MLAQRAKSSARLGRKSVSTPISSTLSDTDPASQRIPSQPRVIQFGQLWAAAENVVTHAFDRAQDRQPATGEHQNIAAQPRPYQRMQRGAGAEQSTRELDFMAQQRNERRIDGAGAQILLRIAEARQILTWQI